MDTTTQQQLSKMSCVECSICYDEIASTNNCVTPCGHVFCFKCMMQSLGNNNTCPCCRAVLIEEPVEEADDESEYEDSDSETDSEDGESEEAVGEIETIAERLLQKGYTMVDMIALLTMRTSKRDDKKYTTEYYSNLEEEFENICDEVDVNAQECVLFAQEDKRI